MKTEPESSQPAIIVHRRYNKKELRFLLGNISLYALNRMISVTEGIGEPFGTFFDPRQILLLLNRFDLSLVFIRNQNKLRER